MLSRLGNAWCRKIEYIKKATITDGRFSILWDMGAKR